MLSQGQSYFKSTHTGFSCLLLLSLDFILSRNKERMYFLQVSLRWVRSTPPKYYSPRTRFRPNDDPREVIGRG